MTHAVHWTWSPPIPHDDATAHGFLIQTNEPVASLCRSDFQSWGELYEALFAADRQHGGCGCAFPHSCENP